MKLNGVILKIYIDIGIYMMSHHNNYINTNGITHTSIYVEEDAADEGRSWVKMPRIEDINQRSPRELGSPTIERTTSGRDMKVIQEFTDGSISTRR